METGKRAGSGSHRNGQGRENGSLLNVAAQKYIGNLGQQKCFRSRGNGFLSSNEVPGCQHNWKGQAGGNPEAWPAKHALDTLATIGAPSSRRSHEIQVNFFAAARRRRVTHK